MKFLKNLLNIFKFLVFLGIHFLYSQTLTGVVKDTLDTPLQNANVIAKPLKESAMLKYAIADHLGRYKLQLDKDTPYEIRVSYLGHQPHVLNYPENSELKTYDFILKSTGEQLKEVVITHQYEPVIVKKDTVSYKVDYFTSGNERKLAEQLEKLPGVEVDKNGSVTFQGKKVSELQVENKPFFGGGTKLGVQNIPADAVDKVEFLDNFNEVGFMKEVSDSDKLVMNIKLKENKKKFLFGDVYAGYGLKDFYLGHAALFYYSPKINVGYIGDANNFGERVFDFQDLMRFQGGMSSFMNKRPSLVNLYAFSSDNREVQQVKSNFHALNLNYTFNPKLDLQGFMLFSDLFKDTQNISRINYLQVGTEENRQHTTQEASTLAMANWKLDYSPTKNTKYFYNIHGEWSVNDFNSLLLSQQLNQQNTFQSLSDVDNVSLKQYIERHQYHNKKNTTTLVINHTYQSSKPINTWLTDEPFLPGLMPIIPQDEILVKQAKQTQGHTLDGLFKHYYIVNNFNHLYSLAGLNLEQNKILIAEQQILDDNSINDFATQGFGNNLDYRLFDYYLGLEYKFKIGNWINKPSLEHHWYNLSTQQNLTSQRLSRAYWEPRWLSEYEFNNAEKITFNYKLTNQFPRSNLMINNFTLQNFNAVFRGNDLLANERFHILTLNYNKNNMYRGVALFANASLNKKTKTIRNVIVLQGINQFTTPLFTNNPETNWTINTNISKKIYRFRLGLSASANGFNYLQEINNIETQFERNNQRVGVNFRTAYKKWPSINLKYNHRYSQFKGLNNNNFMSKSFEFSFDHQIVKHLTFKTDYQWEQYEFPTNINIIKFWNASLFYQKKNSPFGFELKANNILNIDRRFDNTFSDFLISEQEFFVLPRVVLFSISYKL